MVRLLVTTFIFCVSLTLSWAANELIHINQGDFYSPNKTLPAPRFARDSGVCVTVAEQKELESYKRPTSLLINIKMNMEVGIFNIMPVKDGSFFVPLNMRNRWGAAYNTTHVVEGLYPGWWKGPGDQDVPDGQVCERTVNAGPVGLLFWHNHYPDHFDHYLVDHLLVILWLVRIMPPDVKIAIPLDKHPKAYVDWFPSLQERVVWYQRGVRTCVKGVLLAVEPPPPPRMDAGTWRMITLAQNFHEMSLEAHEKPEGSAKRRSVILCSRADSFNGRRLGNEKELADLVKEKMEYYSRKEEFIVYKGDGKSLQEQFEVFNTASVMIGGDGSAMANMIHCPWSANRPNRHSVHVIEATCGTRSIVRANCPYFRTHLLEYALAPWVSYHHVIFNSSSTREVTWVDLDDVREVLDTMWGPALGANTFCIPLTGVVYPHPS